MVDKSAVIKAKIDLISTAGVVWKAKNNLISVSKLRFDHALITWSTKIISQLTI